MISSALLSSLHLLTLALGLGAVVARGRALRATLDEAGLKRLFVADNLWHLALLLWILSGVARVFGPVEKGATYYGHNHMFMAKMTLVLLMLVLELWPTVTFLDWRLPRPGGTPPDTSRARALWGVNHAQIWLAVFAVFAASFMARGIGG